MSLYYNSLQHIHYLVLPCSFVNSFAQSQLPHQNIGSLGLMSLSLFLPYIPMKVKVTVVSDSLRPHGLYSPWNSPGQNTGVGSRSILQESFPTQGLNPGLLLCRWILYQLSYQGSQYISLYTRKILT